MLTWKPFAMEDILHLQHYYAACNYRLCEYAFGTKWMWRNYLHPTWAEAEGCLLIRNTIEGRVQFDYPIPGEGGDEEAALTAIERDCTDRGIRPVISVLPEEKVSILVRRYPRMHLTNERAWKDYMYRTEDLTQFAGRRYSGQRNHISRFRREHPDAVFAELSQIEPAVLEAFWRDYEAEFHKSAELAVWELEASRELFSAATCGNFRAGGLLTEGKLVAISLGEKCGETLIIHIEKALYSYAGVYPTMVQEFARHFGGDCRWINREDDARDRGLRTSKLQYGPATLGSKYCLTVETEADGLQEIPQLRTERLTLDALRKTDQADYNALCLDDARNRWWGYDYRTDLQGELTDAYFLQVAQQDFKARRCINFAVRLAEKCIGEAVLYNCDWQGGMELGCRIAPAYAGKGYGTEAFAAVAEWALYRLGLARVVAKCYHENSASYRMLSSCMKKTGEDAIFDYFEKTV